MFGLNKIQISGGPRRAYFPAEFTALKLLQYMVANEPKGPFTIYRLMRFEPRRWQRRDRIYAMLQALIKCGWVEALPGNPTRYQATEEGRKICPKIDEALELMLEMVSWRVKFVDP